MKKQRVAAFASTTIEGLDDQIQMFLERGPAAEIVNVAHSSVQTAEGLIDYSVVLVYEIETDTATNL